MFHPGGIEYITDTQKSTAVWYSAYPISLQQEPPMKTKFLVPAILLAFLLSACEKDQQAVEAKPVQEAPVEKIVNEPVEAEAPSRFDIYADVRLSTDLSHLSDKQRQMVGLLIDAGKITDDIFWL